MNIKGEKIRLNKSREELVKWFSIGANFEELMPSELQKFEWFPEGDWFRFQLRGNPRIALKKKEVNLNEVLYVSPKADVLYELKIVFTELAEQKTDFFFDFTADLNPLWTQMSKRPLRYLIESFTQKSEELFF